MKTGLFIPSIIMVHVTIACIAKAVLQLCIILIMNGIPMISINMNIICIPCQEISRCKQLNYTTVMTLNYCEYDIISKMLQSDRKKQTFHQTVNVFLPIYCNLL